MLQALDGKAMHVLILSFATSIPTTMSPEVKLFLQEVAGGHVLLVDGYAFAEFVEDEKSNLISICSDMSTVWWYDTKKRTYVLKHDACIVRQTSSFLDVLRRL